MLQFRRVVEITSSICNYIFLVLLLFFGIYASSLWTDIDADFISFVVQLINIVGWTVLVISFLIFLCSIIMIFVDRKFKVGLFIFSLLRILFSIIIMFSIDALTSLVSSGFVVKI